MTTSHTTLLSEIRNKRSQLRNLQHLYSQSQPPKSQSQPPKSPLPPHLISISSQLHILNYSLTLLVMKNLPQLLQSLELLESLERANQALVNKVKRQAKAIDLLLPKKVN